ncbi:sulfatase family protein [Pseudomonas sp. RA_35y_Pfl2_P32]|uniref:sulfatase family protein n=1 Tax=Pseudomonas sp. RA_35y_Pfl2_P32 TaxID=3088705 RepID=UPI0030D7BEDF
MKPRKHLLGVAIAAFATMLSVSPMTLARETDKKTPPRNMVFILVDDLRFDGMGFLQPGLQTPNIDQLAKGGAYFPNAVVTSALCSPSRATILTGQTARTHGVIDNNNSSEKGLTFFPRYLQQAGYQTALIGKWHMGAETDEPRPGFDKWVSFKGQGNYFPTDFLSPAAMKAGVVHTFNVDGKVVPQKGYITDELTDYAMHWLEKERDTSKPFFLYLSHKAVHNFPRPPERYKGQYKDATFKLPESAVDTPENKIGKPMWVQNQRNSWHGLDFFYHSNVKMTDYLKDYYATLSPVDDSVGRIMEYLRKNNLEKNTMVVFYSDNGYLIGDHGLIDKRNAYEGSIKVPLVVYAPGLIPAGVTNPVRVRNLDIAPTLLDVAGVEAPPQFEGKSVLEVASGRLPVGDWKVPDFVYEYYWEWTYPMTPTTFAIQRDQMKYIQYQGIWDIEELYDLESDPREMHNLIDEPRYLETKTALRKALFEQMANADGKHVVPFTERYSRGAVRRHREGPGAAPFPDQWLVEPNRLDRFNDQLADTPAKLKAEQEGRIYFPDADDTRSQR